MKFKFFIHAKRHALIVVCGVAGVMQLGVLAASAQTGNYLYSGSEQTITLNPGLYAITAYGAQGGNANYGGLRGGTGGLGSQMKGEFNFTTATTLTILVGGGGEGGYNFSGGGGGGGSFVFNGTNALVIAGGGGGGGAQPLVGVGYGRNGGNGVTGTNGTSGIYNGGSGGSGGNSGSGGNGGNLSNSTGGGGGGGGYSGSGSNGGSSPGYFPNGGGGGYGYLNGGLGGGGYYSGYGGYGGGGGGGYGGGGGGGGYSGGGGGSGGYNHGPSGGGGGGGSFIDASAVAIITEVSGVSGPDDSPNGEIIITAVPKPIVLALASTASGNFGFNITGPTNATIVIEACTNLANPAWIPVVTNVLSNGTNYFSDARWTNYPHGFYRASEP